MHRNKRLTDEDIKALANHLEGTEQFAFMHSMKEPHDTYPVPNNYLELKALLDRKFRNERLAVALQYISLIENSEQIVEIALGMEPLDVPLFFSELKDSQWEMPALNKGVNEYLIQILKASKPLTQVSENVQEKIVKHGVQAVWNLACLRTTLAVLEFADDAFNLAKECSKFIEKSEELPLVLKHLHEKDRNKFVDFIENEWRARLPNPRPVIYSCITFGLVLDSINGTNTNYLHTKKLHDFIQRNRDCIRSEWDLVNAINQIRKDNPRLKLFLACSFQNLIQTGSKLRTVLNYLDKTTAFYFIRSQIAYWNAKDAKEAKRSHSMTQDVMFPSERQVRQKPDSLPGVAAEENWSNTLGR